MSQPTLDDDRQVRRPSFSKFVAAWERRYTTRFRQIPMFAQPTPQFTRAGRACFARLLYHARGHFHDFLWHLGNSAPDAASKKLILHNYEEELCGERSHEELFRMFARAVGVDIRAEIVERNSYLRFLREFNHAHVRFVCEHEWPTCFAAFAAYERLDNVDYPSLLRLVRSFPIKEDARTFFVIHADAAHFDHAREIVEGLFRRAPREVEKGFAFIADHQLKMWRRLSDTVLQAPGHVSLSSDMG